jgi:hypothetical protein
VEHSWVSDPIGAAGESRRFARHRQIDFALQSPPVQLFKAIGPAILAFPDLSDSPTPCSKAQAVVAAYSGKTLTIPMPNPYYSPWNSKPFFNMIPLALENDPVFSLISSFVSSRCAADVTSESTMCDVAIGIVRTVSENGPYWLQAILGAERAESVIR